MGVEVGPRSSGGPDPLPSQGGVNQLDLNAAAVLVKNALGITSDEIDFMAHFTEKGGKDINRYSPGNPVLDHPMFTGVFDIEFKQNGVTVKKTYNELMQELPPDLQQALKSDVQKAFGRSAPLASLRETLQNTAVFLTFVRQASDVPPPKTSAATTTAAGTQNSGAEVATKSQPAPSSSSGAAAPSASAGAAGTTSASSTSAAAATSTTATSQTAPTSPAGLADSASTVYAGLGQSLDVAEKTVQGLIQQYEASKDPNHIAMADYLKTVSQAIQAARALLNEMQDDDSKNDLVIAQAQRDSIQDKLNDTIAQIQAAAAAAEKQATLKLVFQILGPIIAVAMAAISIMTLGAASPLAVAVCVAISTASVGLSVADSVTGCVSNGLQGMFQDAVGNLSGAGKIFAEIGIMIAICVGVALVGGAASMAVESTAEDVAEGATQALVESVGEDIGQDVSTTAGELAAVSVVREASASAIQGMIKQFNVNLTMNMVMASNVIVDIVTPIVKKYCKDDDKAEAIAEIIQMIVILVAMLAVAKAGSGVTSAGEAVGEGSTRVLTNSAGPLQAMARVATTMKMITALADIGSNGWAVKQHIDLANNAIEQGDLQAALDQIQAVLTQLGINKQKLDDGLKEIAEQGGQGLTTLWDAIISGMQRSVSQIISS